MCFPEKCHGRLLPFHQDESLRKTVAITTTGDVSLPEIISSHFQNPNKVPVTSVIVFNGRFKYLVVGYYDETLAINQALRLVRKRIVWRGGGCDTFPRSVRACVGKTCWLKDCNSARSGNVSIFQSVL